VTEPEAFLECRCGACRITLCDPNVRYRVECLCCDCRQRGLISAGKGSLNELPVEVATYTRGIDLVYFSNMLLVDPKSQDLIEFSKLREDSLSSTAVSACCGTLLFTSHPFSEGRAVIVHADSCRIIGANMIETQAVFFGIDFPLDKYKVRKKRDQIPKVFSPFDEADTSPMIAAVTAISAPIDEEYMCDGFTTFEQLCASKTILVDNSFFEESRIGKPSVIDS
jgi:hypothetical protein